MGRFHERQTVLIEDVVEGVVEVVSDFRGRIRGITHPLLDFGDDVRFLVGQRGAPTPARVNYIIALQLYFIKSIRRFDNSLVGVVVVMLLVDDRATPYCFTSWVPLVYGLYIITHDKR